MGRTKDNNAPYKLPPSIPEQKRIRQKNPTTNIPSPPYLLTSKLLDYTCTSIPILKSICPSPAIGGWRSLVPNKDLVTFPNGKLSHSFYGSLGADGYADVNDDITYAEYMHWVNSGNVNIVQQQHSIIIPGGTSELSITLNNYYNFAFHMNTTTLCDLTNPLALCVLFVLVMIVRFMKKLVMPKFSNLGRNLGKAAHGDEWEAENADRIVKFGEYVYRLCFHSSLSAYGLWYFHNKSWWNNELGGTKNLWIGHPNHPVEPGMSWYYLVQSAYNVDALLSLMELSFSFELVNPFAYSSAMDFLEKEHVVDEDMRRVQVKNLMSKSNTQTVLWTPIFQIKWSPTVRGDFQEMMAHHVVTNALIFFSSYYRFTRIGSMVFVLHDLSDVPIDLSKLANFVKWKVTTIVCFVTMVLLWVVTRLTIFPFVICKSVWNESYEYMVLKGTLDPALHDAYYLLFYTLLGLLVLLHVTWFCILLKIGWTLVSTGERHDYTEHKSGEKQKDV